jgi:hypothetical protein
VGTHKHTQRSQPSNSDQVESQVWRQEFLYFLAISRANSQAPVAAGVIRVSTTTGDITAISSL